MITAKLVVASISLTLCTTAIAQKQTVRDKRGERVGTIVTEPSGRQRVYDRDNYRVGTIEARRETIEERISRKDREREERDPDE